MKSGSINAVQDHIATVRLNRPDKANAMNATMWQDIRLAFDWIDGQADARVAVLEGEGRHFTAGIDLAIEGADRDSYTANPAKPSTTVG